MQRNYSAVIGVHRGLTNVPLIMRALKNQTIPPKDIFVWVSDPNTAPQIKPMGIPTVRIWSNQNRGCFDRFTAGLLSAHTYTMVLDDDTVPGKQWAENCFETANQVGTAVIGCRGIILTTDSYHPFKEAGLAINNNVIQRCDLVGHSWFIPRLLISLMMEQVPVNWYNGEDIHLSAVASLNGLKTFCPPHPINNKELWGSTRRELGSKPGRISTSKGLKAHFEERGKVVKYWVGRGWKPLFKG